MDSPHPGTRTPQPVEFNKLNAIHDHLGHICVVPAEIEVWPPPSHQQKEKKDRKNPRTQKGKRRGGEKGFSMDSLKIKQKKKRRKRKGFSMDLQKIKAKRNFFFVENCLY